MAAPNIVSLTTITGKTAVANVTTVSANVITNAAASGAVLKINNIVLSNYSGTSATGNVLINRAGTNYYLAGGIVVPPTSTLVLIGKDVAFYMEEGDVLQSYASANSSVSLVASYEIIS
jgi:large exoprotein involved in heme utilization and adhesion